jgi:hypothetical protein
MLRYFKPDLRMLVYIQEASIEHVTKMYKMKTLFSLSMLILIAAASFLSYKLFFHAHYDLSALLTMTSIMSAILTVYVLSSRKIKFSE